MEKSAEQAFGELQHTLEALERYRLEIKSKGLKQGGIAAAVCILPGIVCGLMGHTLWLIVLSVVGVVLFIGALYSQADKLTAFYKEKVIARLVGFLCEDAKYEPQGGISQSIFDRSALYQNADRYAAEDLITGKVGETSFSCSEVHAEEKKTTRDSKGHVTTYWVDIFRGFLFVADFNKHFSGQTIVVRSARFFTRISGERVHLEDPDFEKRFKVYSTDQVEARYILSLSLMKRLTELDNEYEGRKITFSFVNSMLVIAIPDQTNHFEASIWQSVLNQQRLAREFNTIKQLIGIVEDLNLNLRIWTK